MAGIGGGGGGARGIKQNGKYNFKNAEESVSWLQNWFLLFLLYVKVCQCDRLEALYLILREDCFFLNFLLFTFSIKHKVELVTFCFLKTTKEKWTAS